MSLSMVTNQFDALMLVILLLVLIWVSLRNSFAIERVHHALNSRLTELIDLTKKVARAEGVAEEQEREKLREEAR